MLLQKDQIDGAATPVNSHGHHHRSGHNDNDINNSSNSRYREDVVLCSVFYFAEPQRAIKRLQARFPHVRFIWHALGDRTGVDYSDIPEADYRAATIYLTFNSSPPSLALMPNLRFIQLLTSGHDHLRGTPLLSNPSIPVATCSGVSARPIAQYVVMQILSWAQQYPRVLSTMRERRWLGPERKEDGDDTKGRRGYPTSHVLAGRRVGIWGYGSIGRQVARILSAMGMHIIACTSSPKTTPASRRLHTQSFLSTHDSAAAAAMGDDEGQLPLEWHSGGTREDFHKFLAADLDILAIFTPLTATTRQALGKAEFDILSHSSSSKRRGQTAPFLVNVSRGPIIVQDDMVAALKDGRLSAAALDVTDPEPLPAEHELWRLPNVSITPHMSWCFEDYVEDCVENVLAENLARLDKGMKLVNQIQ